MDRSGPLVPGEGIKSKGIDALAIRADVSKVTEVEAMFAEMLGACGDIDILVSNASGASHRTGWTGLVANLLQQSGE